VEIPAQKPTSRKSGESATSRMCVGFAICIAFLLASSANAAVTISPDHPESVQQGILAAYAAGQNSVVIPPGAYRIPRLPNSVYHLDLENMNNFEIDATGATFVFQDVTTTGILFYNCVGVLFHGATLYYGTPALTQGVIEAVAADGSYVDVQIEPGYPDLDNSKYFPWIYGNLFDSATRQWKRNVNGDIFGPDPPGSQGAAQRLSPNTFRAFTDDVGSAAVGDLVAFHNTAGDHVIRVTACSRMTLTNLTFYNATGVGVNETLGGDLGPNTYTYLTVKRGPRPPGANTDPLFSTGGGGVNSNEARQGPDIENCEFEWTADDGIAISGQYSWVMQQLPGSGNTTLIVSNAWVDYSYQQGDPLQVVDASGQPVGHAVVTSAVPYFGYTTNNPNPCTIQRPTMTDVTVGPFYQITLDRALPAVGCGYYIANSNLSSSGFVIRKNTIRTKRAHGMILSVAEGGTVEGNIIEGASNTGIVVGPDFYWGQCCYGRNMIIRNNTISDIGYWGGATAGLLVSGANSALAPPGAFQNILIEGNTFENFNVTGLFVSSARGLTIGNNTFTNLQHAVPFEVDNFSGNVLPGTLIFVNKSAGVHLQNNTASQLGPDNTTFVEAQRAHVQGAAYVSVLGGSDGDFSSTQGANHWSYGYFPAGNLNAFTLLPTYNAQSNWWQHVQFGPPWTLLGANSLLQPNSTDFGAEEWATRRWTSTFSGEATISGHLASAPGADPAHGGLYGRIYLNHTKIYEQLMPFSNFTGVDYSLQVTLKAGDILDFSGAPDGTADWVTFSSIIWTSMPAVGRRGNGPAITAASNSAAGEGDFAPATYVSISGQNFAPAGFVDDWSKSVIGGRLPTNLDGVTVSRGARRRIPWRSLRARSSLSHLTRQPDRHW
jgi:Periplasmic copper-binding protein (NosD)